MDLLIAFLAIVGTFCIAGTVGLVLASLVHDLRGRVRPYDHQRDGL